MTLVSTATQQYAAIGETVEFIHVSPGDGSRTTKTTRRRIRVQVMKDYRRKERERQANASS